jgi:hypothetical protein
MLWLTDVQPRIDFATKDATVTLNNGDHFTLHADLKTSSSEKHIASLNAVDFTKSARRRVDFFLGWIKPQETLTAEFTLNGLITGGDDIAPLPRHHLYGPRQKVFH